MLRLPNELLSHVAAFAQDEDLLSLRLTCKLLECLSHKYFIAAFMTEIHFSASPAGIKLLEKKIAHPKFGPCIRTIMASVTEDLFLQTGVLRALLRDVFNGLSRLGHNLRFGVSCRPIHDQTFGTALQVFELARLMIAVKPSELLLERFIIDLRQLPSNGDNHALKNHLAFLSGAIATSGTIFTQSPFTQSDVDILMLNRGQVSRSSLDARWTISEGGSCFEFHDLEHDRYLCWITMLWPINSSVRKVQFKNCRVSICTLEFLFITAQSASWHLELRDCHFTGADPWTVSDSLMLKSLLYNRASGLNSCLLSNLRSQSGPIFAGEFEASSPYEIRERMSIIKFSAQSDVDEEAN